MTRGDVEGLRAAGFDDGAILDAVQVVSYFNYINRLADAIHVDVEPDMPPYPGESRPGES
jgi:alkylhydroperoxidase family enzyme